MSGTESTSGIGKLVEAVPLPAWTRLRPLEAGVEVYSGLMALEEVAGRRLREEQPEGGWARPERVRGLLLATWLRLRPPGQICSVAAAFLTPAVTRICLRYRGYNPYGVQGERGSRADLDTFCAEALADACVWLAEPRLFSDRPRWQVFLEAYLAKLRRVKTMGLGPLDWIGDKVRKRVVYRCKPLGAEVSLEPFAEESLDEALDRLAPRAERGSEPVLPGLQQPLAASGALLDELFGHCCGTGLQAALAKGRELQDPDVVGLAAEPDLPARCFMLHRSMETLTPEERAEVARGAGFGGKTPEAALRMQHDRADRALHRLGAALLQHGGGPLPEELTQVPTSALAGLATCARNGVLQPDQAELLGFWCGVDPRGAAPFQALKARLKVTAPVAFGKVLRPLKSTLITALEQVLAARPPRSGRGAPMSRTCPAGYTAQTWQTFHSQPAATRTTLLQHLGSCEVCLSWRLEARRLFDEDVARRALPLAEARLQRPRLSTRLWNVRVLAWGGGLAATAALVALLLLPSGPGPEPKLAQVLEQNGQRLRAGAGQPGDTLLLEAQVGDWPVAELRVYLDEKELVLRCSDAPPCQRKGGLLSARLLLTRTGLYQAAVLVSPTPLPAPQLQLEEDLQQALDQGARLHRAAELPVTP